MSDLEKKFELSEKIRKNAEFIMQSAPKVKEVYEQLEHIQETGIAPIQKALDEIDILKQNQTVRYQRDLELQQVIGQVRARDTELDDFEKQILMLLKKKLETQ